MEHAALPEAGEDARGPRGARRPEWWSRSPHAIAFALHAIAFALLGAFLALRAVRGWSKALSVRGNDLTIYLDGAAAMAAGRDPIEVEGILYLPAFCALLAPLDALPRAVAAGVWQAASLACALAGVWGSARLADASRERPWLPWVVLLLTLRLWDSNLAYGQANAFTFAALVAALALLVRARATAAGAVLGLAAAFKVLPGVGFALLAARGHARALAVGAGVLALACALPAVWLGPRGAVDAHVAWFRAVPAPYLAGGEALLDARPYVAGQSLLASAYRALAATPTSANAPAARAALAEFHPDRVHVAVRVAVALHVGALLFLLWRGRRERGALVTHGALAITTALVVGPLVHKAHLAWVALAYAVLLVRWHGARGRARWGWSAPLVAAILALGGTTPALIGTEAAREALGRSAPFAGVWVLWLALAVAAWRGPRDGAEPPPRCAV